MLWEVQREVLNQKTSMSPFYYKGWSLYEAIDALIAYDQGASDSGVSDLGMKETVKQYLLSLDDAEFRKVCADYAIRHYLDEKSIANGYGLADVKGFINWLSKM